MEVFCHRCQRSFTWEGATEHAVCPLCGQSRDMTWLNTSFGPVHDPLGWDTKIQQIGPYRIESRIGSGGMGTVFKAADSRNGAVVAVKLLYPGLSAQPHLVDRFKREARTLRSLDHPRIVGFVDDGEHQKRPYIVMEYIEGLNLDVHCQVNHVEPPGVLKYAEQICEALAAAHRAGVIHRDLKPSNVIVAMGGARVLDFGIAQISTEEFTFTQSGSISGTLLFMAPEQHIPGKAVDQRCDLYALGAILYYLFTGDSPVGTGIRRASEANPNVPRRYDRLISKALHNRPERRYQSAEAMMADLRKLQRTSKVWTYLAAISLLLFILILAWYGVYGFDLSASSEVKPPQIEMKAGPAITAADPAALLEESVTPAPVPPPEAGALDAAKDAKDPARGWIVQDDAVSLHEEPSDGSKTVGTLSKGETVTRLAIVHGGDGQDWFKVKTKAGLIGLAPARYFK